MGQSEHLMERSKRWNRVSDEAERAMLDGMQERAMDGTERATDGTEQAMEQSER